jgi:membrane fusion protein, multidrug efflux system
MTTKPLIRDESKRPRASSDLERSTMTEAVTIERGTAADTVRNSRVWLKRTVLALALIVGSFAAADYGYYYWVSGRFLVSTDDAYVKADYTAIAPKISGYIDEVLVTDNERVGVGKILARIDESDFRAALNQADADVAAARATIANLNARIALQQSLIEQAKAQIANSTAALDFARQEDGRYRKLMLTGYGTVQRAQQASAELRQKAASVDQAQAGLLAAEKQTKVLKTERDKAKAALARSEAVAQQATLNLSYTTITAPISGTVGARSLRVGQYVQAGTQLMAIVPLRSVYAVASFKETQLTDVRNGQPAAIEVDTFPGVTFHGHVDSLAPASGLEFALLPPDNATGNFTKIVQRIPVKIVFDDGKLAGLLRPGMSVEATIDTKASAPSNAAQSGQGHRMAAR